MVVRSGARDHGVGETTSVQVTCRPGSPPAFLSSNAIGAGEAGARSVAPGFSRGKSSDFSSLEPASAGDRYRRFATRCSDENATLIPLCRPLKRASMIGSVPGPPAEAGGYGSVAGGAGWKFEAGSDYTGSHRPMAAARRAGDHGVAQTPQSVLSRSCAESAQTGVSVPHEDRDAKILISEEPHAHAA